MTSSAHPPPDDFLHKMQQLLSPDEYGRFLASYAQPAQVGLRVNTLKLSVDDFTSMSPFPLTPVGAFDRAAYTIPPDERPGRHPYHDAGLYYLQEPSAMVAAALLAPQPGDMVLDIAAAPGGKATHLSSLLNANAAAGEGSVLRRTIHSDGLLVANDIVRNRASILAENLTRWGAANSLITTSEPERLIERFGPVFDRVLVDAPCSGEGMFRRQGGFDWSERIVVACAQRQSSLLATAAGLVRPGGRLLYATCTFSPEENEGTIGRFLAQHPDYEISDPPRFAGFGHGQPAWADHEPQPALSHAVRLWPQDFPGEGHFLALLQRSAAAGDFTTRSRDFAIRPPAAAELAHWRVFAAETLALDVPEDRLHAAGGRLYLIPAHRPDTGRLNLVRYGIVLGDFRPGYFRPSGDLALALVGDDSPGAVNWPADDDRLSRYLAGEDNPGEGPNGWQLVTVDGFGLGWAKRVDGRLKNHYPRHLRRGVARGD